MTTNDPTTKEAHATVQSANQTHQDDYTRFQHDLLAVIAGYENGRYRNNRHSEQLPHGLAIKQSLEGYLGEEIHHGRLYPNLDTLVERGLINKTQADRRTNYYQLTDDGWDFLNQRAQFLVNCIDNGEDGDAE